MGIETGEVSVSVRDPLVQDLLWEYASRCRPNDTGFADALQTVLLSVGYEPPDPTDVIAQRIAADASRAAVDIGRSAIKGGRLIFNRLNKIGRNNE